MAPEICEALPLPLPLPCFLAAFPLPGCMMFDGAAPATGSTPAGGVTVAGCVALPAPLPFWPLAFFCWPFPGANSQLHVYDYPHSAVLRVGVIIPFLGVVPFAGGGGGTGAPAGGRGTAGGAGASAGCPRPGGSSSCCLFSSASAIGVAMVILASARLRSVEYFILYEDCQEGPTRGNKTNQKGVMANSSSAQGMK